MNKLLVIFLLLLFQNSSNNNNENYPRYLSTKIPSPKDLKKNNYCILKFEKDETSQSALNVFLKSIRLDNKEKAWILFEDTGINTFYLKPISFNEKCYIKFTPGDALIIYFTIFQAIGFVPEKMKEYTIKLKVDERNIEGHHQDWEFESDRKKTIKSIKKINIIKFRYFR